MSAYDEIAEWYDGWLGGRSMHDQSFRWLGSRSIYPQRGATTAARPSSGELVEEVT